MHKNRHFLLEKNVNEHRSDDLASPVANEKSEKGSQMRELIYTRSYKKSQEQIPVKGAPRQGPEHPHPCFKMS